MLIHRLLDCPEFLAGDQTHLRQLLHPEKHPVQIRYSIAHATVQPGASSLRHALKTTEIYFILQGQGEMHIDDEVAQVGPGDTVYIPERAVQFIHNPGKGDLIFLCIVDPAWREEDEVVL